MRLRKNACQGLSLLQSKFSYLKELEIYCPLLDTIGIFKPRYDSSNSSASINILTALPPVPDPDWYIYDEDYYNGKFHAL